MIANEEQRLSNIIHKAAEDLSKIVKLLERLEERQTFRIMQASKLVAGQTELPATAKKQQL